MPPAAANGLAAALSPYLLAHADDPVDWHEWGDEAFAAARRRDVPLLLSVGYSACHWCHVMHRESFSDPEIARFINDWFVAVKVDREERPDVDRIYLDAVTVLTGRAGWPLTAFLTPAGEPFFGGTYFPQEDRHGLPAFDRVLRAVHDAWCDRRGQVTAAAADLTRRLAAPPPPPGPAPGNKALRGVYRALEASYDPAHGGFGGAPKFPQASSLEFLLRVSGADWAPQAEAMARRSLHGMADGGIHDQVGGGFARYSVDERWLVPHFEKMLYDNALLARLYARGAQVTGQARFAAVARRTLDYLLADLALPGGGFASAEDADTEGEEGRFYTFTWEEFVAAAGADAGAAAAALGVTPQGNFEGRNVLHRALPASRVAEETGLSLAEVEEAVARALAALGTMRAARARPARDDKAVAAWNGLAVRALAESSVVLGEPRYLEAGAAAARFVLGEMRGPDGRLRRARREGRDAGPGFCDDYAAMALGLLALFRVDGDEAWFGAAAGLVEDMVDLFGDPTTGAFFSTGRDAAGLIARPVNLSDHPVPSDNALAAEALLTLASYTGDHRHLDRAEAILRAAASYFDRAPGAVGYLAGVLAVARASRRELVVVGPPEAPATRALLAVAEEAFRPELVVARSNGRPSGAVPLLEGRLPVGGLPAAYLCRDFTCAPPITEPDELRRLLAGGLDLPGDPRRVGP
ncbi:MAG: thioredoxin domain-containing protein [Acidimicrobiia bacterium]|nr:thioredoxin domain-containing protein [Acidimicrobiia bacterium]